jgi:hypothetical protein
VTVAFVQKSTQLYADNTTSIAPSLSGCTTGNHVEMEVGIANGDTTSPANAVGTPTGGWSVAIAPVGPTGAAQYKPAAAIFYKENIAGGTHSGTITMVSGSYARANITEHSGVATSNSLDVTASNTAASGTSGDTGTTAATANADSIAVCTGTAENGTSVSNFSSPASAGWTVIDTTPDNSFHVAGDQSRKILSATGTQSGSWTWTTSAPFAGVIAVFKGATAATAPVGGLQLAYPFRPLGERTGRGSMIMRALFPPQHAVIAAITADTPVNPGVGSLVITGYAPTIAQPQTAAPGAGTITLTGFAPAVVQNAQVNPGVGSLVLTGYAPTIAQPQTASPGVGTITLTGYAPAVVQNTNVAPGVGSLAITGYAPSISQPQTAAPGVGTVTLTGYAPTVVQNAAVAPGVGSLSITGYAPAVVQNTNVAADVGTLAITGYAPSLAQTANQAIAAGVGSVVLTGYAPTVAQASSSTSIDMGAGVLAITGYAPDVAQTGGGGNAWGSQKKKTRAQIQAEVNARNLQIIQQELEAEHAQDAAQVAQAVEQIAYLDDDEDVLMLLL